jgi:hypothetical protein
VVERERPEGTNVYAPPVADHDSAPPTFQDPGNYWIGFAFGLFCGCIALIASFFMKRPESKRGIVHGFAVGLVLGLAARLLGALLE